MKKLWYDCSKTKRLLKSLLSLCIASLLLHANGCKKAVDDTDADSPTDVSVSTNVDSRLLIVPGKSIGNISLEHNSEDIEAILGRPDLSDAAMGKAWLTWFSKVNDSVTGNELNIYTEYKDNSMREKVVRQIRVTSDDFKTAEGMCTGKTIDELLRNFPSIKMVGKYDVETRYPVTVYDAVDAGIAFEAEDNVCVGIIVHPKGIPVSEEYISFHPDMKPM